MNSRGNVLKRIEAVYGLVELIHSTALRQASVLVDEVERAIDEQRIQSALVAQDARAALASGDRQGWVITEVQRAWSCGRGSQLQVLRLEREIVSNLARDEYRASRLRSEQVKTVVQRNDAAEVLVAGRRTQAVADDRFLSRLYLKPRKPDGG